MPPIKDTNALTAKHFLGLAVVCVTIVGSVGGGGWAMANAINNAGEEATAAVQAVTVAIVEIKTKVDSIEDTVSYLEHQNTEQGTKITEQGKDIEFIKDRVERSHP